MKEWQIGYLAGMVDAECHVGIQRETGRARRTPAYVVRFELAMTDKKSVDFVNSLLPEAKVVYVGANGRRLPYYRLRVTQQEALSLLRLVYPYVQGKKRQIEICFEIDALRRKYTPSRIHTGKSHFQRIPPEFEEAAYPLFVEFRSLQLNKRVHK
jgi:hypothetical protein